jgi:hypothetical protein
MAMDKTRLGDAIATRIMARNPETGAYMSPEQIAQMKLYWQDVAQEIIAEIIAHSVITVNAWSAQAPGVATGAGTSSTITGTATGGVTS